MCQSHVPCVYTILIEMVSIDSKYFHCDIFSHSSIKPCHKRFVTYVCKTSLKNQKVRGDVSPQSNHPPTHPLMTSTGILRSLSKHFQNSIHLSPISSNSLRRHDWIAWHSAVTQMVSALSLKDIHALRMGNM